METANLSELANRVLNYLKDNGPLRTGPGPYPSLSPPLQSDPRAFRDAVEKLVSLGYVSVSPCVQEEPYVVQITEAGRRQFPPFPSGAPAAKPESGPGIRYWVWCGVFFLVFRLGLMARFFATRWRLDGWAEFAIAGVAATMAASAVTQSWRSKQ